MDHKVKGRFVKRNNVLWFQMAAPKITVDAKGKPCKPFKGGKWCDSWLVYFPTSCRYNGGTIVNGKWVQGVEVGKPKIPKGFELVGIGCGHQLNAFPPYATRYLKKAK
jgi:hypothetical protein